MHIKIEEITQKQIPVIQDLADQVYMVTYRGIHSEEQNAYMMEQMYSTESLTRQMTEEKSRFLLLSVDKKASGYCAFKPYSGEEHNEGKLENTPKDLPIVYLDKLYVLPALQGLGLGKKLVEAVIHESECLYPEGCIIRLDVNKINKARAFYEHLGFTVKRYWDAPIGHGFFMNGCTMDLLVKNSQDNKA